MKCPLCDVEKLSKEFPYFTATMKCKHPALNCLQCVIEHVSKEPAVCPYMGCNEPVDDAAVLLEQCQHEIDVLYPPVDDPIQTFTHPDEITSELTQVVNIATMTGDLASIKFHPAMTIDALKIIIQERLKVEPNKQLLMYNDVALEPTNESGKEMHLQDYSVKPFSTIHLMVLLYAIPEHFNHVIFDLYWGFPAHGPDFLDASCLIYSGKNFQHVINYNKNQCSIGPCVQHSGDIMDETKCIGHHTIEVRLKDIPASINHLYFTLSAWNSPTIAHFPNPSLKFFEASNKEKDLCKTTFTHACNSQAVIMCALSRTSGGVPGKGGKWRIIEGGMQSAGNAKNYAPLKSFISALMMQGEGASQPNLLDLAFAMDCTGSMGSYITQAKENIKTIIQTIVSREHADVRSALVEYRDHPPQDATFVTRILNFTGSDEMKTRLDGCTAAGGGDGPEAVVDALHDLLKLTWREGSAKICVFISDAPPHGLIGPGDGFPDGCPCGLDAMRVARDIASKGITVYTVGCEPAINPYKEWFMAISHITGGQYVPLLKASLLSQVIVGGAQEEIALQKLMAEVNLEVRKQLEEAPDGSVEQADIAAIVFKKLSAKGVQSKQLSTDVGELPAVTSQALLYSELENMKDVRECFKAAAAGHPGMTSGMAVGTYEVKEGGIRMAQCSRLVQRSLLTTNLKSKCAKPYT